MFSCCIADHCGAPFDPTTKESRPLDTLRAFWSLYCPKHRARPATQIALGDAAAQQAQATGNWPAIARLEQI